MRSSGSGLRWLAVGGIVPSLQGSAPSFASRSTVSSRQGESCGGGVLQTGNRAGLPLGSGSTLRDRYSSVRAVLDERTGGAAYPACHVLSRRRRWRRKCIYGRTGCAYTRVRRGESPRARDTGRDEWRKFPWEPGGRGYAQRSTAATAAAAAPTLARTTAWGKVAGRGAGVGSGVPAGGLPTKVDDRNSTGVMTKGPGVCAAAENGSARHVAPLSSFLTQTAGTIVAVVRTAAPGRVVGAVGRRRGGERMKEGRFRPHPDAHLTSVPGRGGPSPSRVWRASGHRTHHSGGCAVPVITCLSRHADGACRLLPPLSRLPPSRLSRGEMGKRARSGRHPLRGECVNVPPGWWRPLPLAATINSLPSRTPLGARGLDRLPRGRPSRRRRSRRRGGGGRRCHPLQRGGAAWRARRLAGRRPGTAAAAADEAAAARAIYRAIAPPLPPGGA